MRVRRQTSKKRVTVSKETDWTDIVIDDKRIVIDDSQHIALFTIENGKSTHTLPVEALFYLISNL
jgi:hypothetical protein